VASPGPWARDPESGHPMLRFFWFWRKRSSGKVIDYPPIKLDVCPDDPSSRDYYCRRQILLNERGYGDLTRKFDIKIATRQNWTCPVCLGSLGSNLGEPLHMHHIVELSNGGKDVPSNRGSRLLSKKVTVSPHSSSLGLSYESAS
jgi:hypothetical protein